MWLRRSHERPHIITAALCCAEALATNERTTQRVQSTDNLLFTNYLHCCLPLSIYVFFVFLMQFTFVKY